MSKHEVVKYNKNFVSGDYYEQKVLKEDQAARNTITIQLRDAATGELVEEAFTENAINSALESYGYSSIGNRLYNGNLLGAMDSKGFSCGAIVLSDSAISEMEDPYMVHGNIKGVCNWDDATAAGTNKLKGIFNQAESYSKIEDGCIMHIHRVYDWQTSTGNGKIQSLWWLALPVGYGTSEYTEMPGLSYFNALRIAGAPRVPSSDYLFTRKTGDLMIKNTNTNTTSKWNKVLNPMHYMIGCEPAKLSTEEFFCNRHEINGYYYTFGMRYGNHGTTDYFFYLVINKIDSSGAVVDSWEEDLVASVPQFVNYRSQNKMGYENTNSTYYNVVATQYFDWDGWALISITQSSGKNERIFPAYENGVLIENKEYSVTYTICYNVLTKRMLFTGSPWEPKSNAANKYRYCRPLRKKDDDHYCNVFSQFTASYPTPSSSTIERRIVKVGTDDITSIKFLGCESIPGLYSVGSMEYAEGLHPTLPFVINGSDSNSYGGFIAMCPITAHTRLASPINKTSMNTMKIQYDFFFKVPLGFMQADKAWALYD